MAKLAEKLWRRLFSRKGPWRLGGVVEAATDIPLALESHNGVLVGSTEHPKWTIGKTNQRQVIKV